MFNNCVDYSKHCVYYYSRTHHNQIREEIMSKQTDAPQFVADLSGGNFAQQLGVAISD